MDPTAHINMCVNVMAGPMRPDVRTASTTSANGDNSSLEVAVAAGGAIQMTIRCLNVDATRWLR